MGCSSSRPAVLVDTPSKGQGSQPQLQPRGSGGRRQCSAAAPHADALALADSGLATATSRAKSCKSPSVDSARHNSGHLTSDSLPASRGSSSSAKLASAQAGADAMAVDAMAAAQRQRLDADDSCGGSVAAVLASVVNMATATVALTAVDRPQSGGGSCLADAAASLARDLMAQAPRQRQAPRRELLVIMDLMQDARTKSSPYVNGQLASLRFFAGAPLLDSENGLLGMLCIADTEPRQFGAEACTLLANCAAIAARDLEPQGATSRGSLAQGSGAAATGGRQPRQPPHSSRAGGGRGVSIDGRGQQPPLPLLPLLPALSAPVRLQHQHPPESPLPEALESPLPAPLLQVQHDVVSGGIAAKRFAFERTSGSSGDSSRSSSLVGSRPGSIDGVSFSRNSGGRTCMAFDTAAAAAVSAMVAEAAASRLSADDHGSSSSSAAGDPPGTSHLTVTMSSTGIPIKRYSIDRDSDVMQRADTAQASSVPLPKEVPGSQTAGGAEVRRFSFERPAPPTASSFRSDTAGDHCASLYSSLLVDARATTAAMAVAIPSASKPGPPRSLSARLDPDPLPRIPSGEPEAPPVLVSAFATEAVQRPAFDDDMDAKITAAANAAARLAARAASSGGARPPSWRGPPPGSAGRSSSSSLELSCWGSGGLPARAQRAASLPPPNFDSVSSMALNPDTAAVRTSASMFALGSAAAGPCSRRGSLGASPLGPGPKPCAPPHSPPATLGSSASSELADALAAELGLPPATEFGLSAPEAGGGLTESSFRRAAGAPSRGVALMDASLAGWRLLYVNHAFAEATGVATAGGAFWQHFELPDTKSPMAGEPWRQFGARILNSASFGMTVAVAEDTSVADRPRAFNLSLRPASRRALDEEAAAILLPTAGIANVFAADAVPAGLYFVKLQAVVEPSRRCSLDAAASARRLSGSGGAGGSCELLSSSRRLSMRSEASLSLTPFAEVRLGGLLGKGSFGSVYLGWRGEQEIAVKVIHHTGVLGDAAAKELEATLGQRLEHDNIVRTYDYATRTSGVAASFKRSSSRFASNSVSGRTGSAGATARASADAPHATARQHETWILLELCNAGSLQNVNDAGRLRMAAASSPTAHLDDPAARGDELPPPPPPDMRQLMACAVEISDAMRYLHSRGMLHGDLTCNNVLLSEDKNDPRGFTTKVSDFGLSRSMHTESSLDTNTFGTVTHMPPELLSEGRLSKAADVYSFGVMLWEMYCMQRPWAGLRPIQVIMKKASGASTLEWPAGTPTPYKQLAQECMCNEPNSRPTFAEAAQRCRDMAISAAAGELLAGPAPVAKAASGEDSGRGLRKLPTL